MQTITYSTLLKSNCAIVLTQKHLQASNQLRSKHSNNIQQNHRSKNMITIHQISINITAISLKNSYIINNKILVKQLNNNSHPY